MMPTTPQWFFGPFRLDTMAVRLWDGAIAVALPPKAFDVLHYLVTHPDRLVTKDELLDAVWPATAVTDAVVRVAIGVVRKALGETAQTPRYIATVPRRGYRFLAPVTPGDCRVPPSPEGQRLPATCAACGPSRAGGPAMVPPASASVEVATPAQVVSPAMATAGPLGARHGDIPTSLGPQGPPTPATLDGERKQVTVLVAEIPATLALLRDQDAEVVQQLVEPALQAMVDAVHRYDGRVHHVRGAGLLALFGAPQAHEDHALRACYAALAIQTALRAYADDIRRTHGWTLQGRIGLHAGEVVLRPRGNDGLREPSLLGPTTALADHLQQWAPPDTIVLSATTARR
jgi:DNA-binding winged helix-turn-helix (wHTH) protein/class 3 adenylate cyclase